MKKCSYSPWFQQIDLQKRARLFGEAPLDTLDLLFICLREKDVNVIIHSCGLELGESAQKLMGQKVELEITN